MTCDGNAFGTGTNPTLNWSGAPTGTMSYAIVFKDISLLADTTSSTAETDINIQHGYHWAMWDIPAATTHLSTGAMTGYHSADISGALQWSQRNNYGYFPPCPNPFPKGDARFSCSLTLDSYSYTLYAFPFAHLPSLPAPDLNANGEPTGNYVAKLGRYIESLSALAVTEYRGTSSAWASAFSPPAALEYPCAADDTGRRRHQGGRRRQAGWQHAHVPAVTTTSGRGDGPRPADGGRVGTVVSRPTYGGPLACAARAPGQSAQSMTLPQVTSPMARRCRSARRRPKPDSRSGRPRRTGRAGYA